MRPWIPTSSPGSSSTADAPSDPLLVVEDLSVGFPTDDGLVQAVRGVSYDLQPREVLGIVGGSGSGKSVSTMALLGLLPQTARITGRPASAARR